QQQLPVLLCSLLITVFAIRFGGSARYHEQHKALVFVTAFQALFKLLALLLIALIAIYQVFGSGAAMQHWLATQDETLALIKQSLNENNSRSLILIFFASALLMPHSYHVIFSENRQQN